MCALKNCGTRGEKPLKITTNRRRRIAEICVREVCVNKVKDRCGQNKHAKFYYTSNRIFTELKVIKVVLYLLAVVPVVLSFIPQVSTTQNLICSIISFALSIVTECVTSFLTKHKDAGIHSLQLFETGVSGTTFSKIEYDRELTNEQNELAIRKGLRKAQDVEEKYGIYVPNEVNDEFSYLYICRINAATNKYLLSRIFYIYFFFNGNRRAVRRNDFH